MRYRTLGGTELEVPEVSLGSWAMGGSGLEGEGWGFRCEF